jgi:hypothetical protein
MKRVFYRVKTPPYFSDLDASTLEEAKIKLADYGTSDKNSEYFEKAEKQRAECVINLRLLVMSLYKNIF